MVEQDLARGKVVIPGLPPLRLVRTEHLGGLLDTVTRRLCGPSVNPIVWYIGPRQAEILLRRDPNQTRTLLYSAEGGGKTVLMAQWLIVQVLTLLEAGQMGAIGATAPTHERLQTLVKAIGQRIPIDSAKERKAGSWATYYTEERELRCPSGHLIQFRSTKKQSAATGSPVQGFTWLASGDDELQDTAENGADPDIEARLRGAQTSYRMCSATAKDSPGWRTFRDSKATSSDWRIERLRFNETPFVWPEHWERMRRNMSAREWDRRGLALDVGPERQVYFAWERDKNVRPVPAIGKKDVTAQVLGGYHALVGHDPGQLQDVSLVLKCYEVERQRLWWVVDEIWTEQTSTDQHLVELKDRLQNTWQLQFPQADEPKVLVRCDPMGDSDNKTDRSIYTAFRIAGFKILSAAYTAKGDPKGRVPKEAGIAMVNRLLCNAAGERRLFVDCDDRRQPAAPHLVEALELSARNEAEKAEIKVKGKPDLSHSTAALRYALYPYERLRDVNGIHSTSVML